MASKYESYCNSTSDLKAILSSIDSYDRKTVLSPNWVLSSGSLYYLHGSGFCSVLFRNSRDLGTDKGSTPSAEEEFYYNSSEDRLEYYEAGTSASALNGDVWEAGEDWITLKNRTCSEQADRIRSYINRPILKRSNSVYQGASERNYDWIVIRCNAALAVADLIYSIDPDKAREIEDRITNNEKTGLLDKLKSKSYALWNETTWRSEGGVITYINYGGSSTGFIADLRMGSRPNVLYDDVRAVISTGGTISVGTANTTVKYDIYTANDEGLKQEKIVDGELINGSYQAFAYNGFIRWSGSGVFTTGDEFSIVFQSDEVAIGNVKSGQIYR
tara:strand:- start:896 stop:1885 length:990 start_codon:yes stop_codon:yes gene_type:complete